MTFHEPEPGVHADRTETLVRERFEAAVGQVRLDVATLVVAGTATGQRLRSRRRVQQGVAAVAGVAVVATAGVVGVQGGLFDNGATPPADGTVTQLVRSNPRALAAAVLTHLPGGAQVVGVAGSNLRGRDLQAEIGFEVGSVGVDLVVAALDPKSVGEASCASPPRMSDCTDVTSPDGTRVLTGTYRDSGPGNREALTAMVLVVGQSQAVGVLETGIGNSNTVTLPLSGADLRRIAIDPLVGFSTSQQMIDEGAALDHFRSSLVELGSGSGSGSGSGQIAPPPVTRNPPSSHLTAAPPPIPGPSTRPGSSDSSSAPASR